MRNAGIRHVLLLGFTSLLTDVSTEMVYPLLPLFLTAGLGATPGVVGLIEGCAESLASLLKTWSGRLADRSGRRKPLAQGGYAFSVLARGCFALASSWVWVLAGRLLDRFGKGIRTAPRDALLADAAPPEMWGRAYGLHRAMDTAGAFVGVLIAYAALRRGVADYRSLFLWSVVPAALGLVFLAAVVEGQRAAGPGGRPAGGSPAPAGTGPAGGGEAAASRGALARWRHLDGRLRAFLVITLLFTLGNSSNQFLLLRAAQNGFAPDAVLLLYLLFNAVYAVSSYPAGRLSDLIGRRWVLVGGYALFGLVYLGFAAAAGPGWFPWLFAAYGLYSGMTEGVGRALVADLAPAGQRATLLGLHATAVGLGLLPASLLAGLLWDAYGPAAPFYFGGLLGLGAAGAMARALGAPKRSSRQGSPRMW